MTDVVFLFDVDNTLLDNDSIIGDLRDYLTRQVGEESCRRYFTIFEHLRQEIGYADYLGALQRYRHDDLCDLRILELSSYLVDYPFGARLFPGWDAALRHVSRWGPSAILSDGDVVFQPLKIQRSGIWQGVEGRVMIYIHKEAMLADVERRYPAEHYVMVDDKLRLLTAMKAIWGKKLTTVFPRQGHYAHDATMTAAYPPADVTIERIADLVDVDFDEVMGRVG